MRKLLSKLIVITCFLFISIYGLSQNDSLKNIKIFKHSFSAQYNNVYDRLEELIWHNNEYIKRRQVAIRYSYRHNPNISFGPEISGFDRKSFQTDTTILAISNDLNIGSFARYNLNKPKFFKPFAEVGLYYQRAWSLVWFSWVDGISRNCFNRFGVYVAPGISFCFVKNRVNFDIMYKFSNLDMANYKKSVISWRITYNFNVKGC
jgi:hypothetical protein